MKIVIESIGSDLTDRHKEYIGQRLNKFFDKQEYITGIDVYVKKADEKNEDEYTVEAKVFLPGPELFAKSEASTYEKALNDTIEKLRRQLEKYKEKHFSKR